MIRLDINQPFFRWLERGAKNVLTTEKCLRIWYRISSTNGWPSAEKFITTECNPIYYLIRITHRNHITYNVQCTRKTIRPASNKTLLMKNRKTHENFFSSRIFFSLFLIFEFLFASQSFFFSCAYIFYAFIL